MEYIKSDEEVPYFETQVVGYSNFEEVKDHIDGEFSSEELSDEMYGRSLSKIQVTSSAGKLKKPKRQSNKLDCLDVTYSTKGRGSKRKSEPTYIGDLIPQPKRKYSKQRKVIKGMEMFLECSNRKLRFSKTKIFRRICVCCAVVSLSTSEKVWNYRRGL